MVSKVLFFSPPQFFPPLDFFFGLLNSDIWVVLDHVRFTSRSRQSRCRIKTDEGIAQLQIGVKRPQNKPICATVIDNRALGESIHPWKHDFLRNIKLYYHDTPFFNEYYPEIVCCIEGPNVLLETLTLGTTLWAAHLLGKEIQYFRTSDLGTTYSSHDRYTAKFPISRIIPLLLEKFSAVPFNTPFSHPEYPQRQGPFERDLSVIDSLMCVGADNVRVLLTR